MKARPRAHHCLQHLHQNCSRARRRRAVRCPEERPHWRPPTTRGRRPKRRRRRRVKGGADGEASKNRPSRSQSSTCRGPRFGARMSSSPQRRSPRATGVGSQRQAQHTAWRRCGGTIRQLERRRGAPAALRPEAPAPRRRTAPAMTGGPGASLEVAGAAGVSARGAGF